MKTNNIIGSLLLFFFLSSTHTYAQKFTIPIFPDTQEALTKKRGMFFSQLEWLVTKKDSLNIPIVLHVGDLVNYDNFDQWELASVGMKMLDRSNIPYAIALGNHDTEAVGEFSGSAAPGNVNVNLRKTHKFNHYFPPRRFILQKGAFEKDKSDNSFYTFEAGGLKWIVITIEFCARENAVDWMDKILKQHPDHNAIVLTHYHLTSKGDICMNNAGYGDMNVSDIFENYIKPNKNVLMVLSGHVCYYASKVDEGSNGNKIYQLLQNYQGTDFGGGYLRLLDIDTKKGTITANFYSPYYEKTLGDEANVLFEEVKFIK